MNKDMLKQVIADNQIEVANYQIIERKFNYEGFGNYVFTGIRRAGKSFLLYQHIQQFLDLLSPMVLTIEFCIWSQNN
jgi:predicted AAA+ superfamily ATPase